MTASRRAHELGTTVKEAAEAYGCTVQNLYAKFLTNRKQFEIICLGVAALKRIK